MKQILFLSLAMFFATTFTSCKKKTCGEKFAITLNNSNIYNGTYVNTNSYGNYGYVNTGVGLQVGMVAYFELCDDVVTYTGYDNPNNGNGNNNGGGNNNCTDYGFQIIGAEIPKADLSNFKIGDQFWGVTYAPAGVTQSYYVMCDPEWITITGILNGEFTFSTSSQTFSQANDNTPAWIPSHYGGGDVIKNEISKATILGRSFARLYFGTKSCAY